MSTNSPTPSTTQERIRVSFLFNNSEVLSEKTEPQKGNGVYMLLCVEGSASFNHNGLTTSLHPNELTMFHDNQLPSILLSDNGCVIMLYLSEVLLPRFFTRDKRNPITSNSEFGEYFNMMMNELLQQDIPLQSKLTLSDQTTADIASLLMVLSHQINQNSKTSLSIYPLVESIIVLLLETLFLPVKQDVRGLSRQEEITSKFFTTLLRDHSKHYDLSHYASELCVSPKYLSSVVAQTTKYPAQEWIARMTTFHAKRLLMANGLTIAQISDQLGFSSPSTFIRFFRRRTGKTPNAYRNNKELFFQSPNSQRQ